MKVTKRDLHLLQILHNFSLLSTLQINILVFPEVDYRTVLRRLRKLEASKLIQRTKEYRGGMSVWHLTGTGARRIGVIAQIRTINKNVLQHDLLVNDLRMRLTPLKMITTWKSAHQIKHERGLQVQPLSKMLDTIPGWLCSINSWTGQLNVAIEVELSYKGQERMKNIFYAYLRKGKLHHLWYFVPTKNFGLKLAEILKGLKLSRELNQNWFLWSIIPEVVEHSTAIKLHTVNGELDFRKLFVVPAHRDAHTVGMRKIERQNLIGANI